MKNAIAALVLAAVTVVMWAAQCWLEANRFDRAELALISVFAGGLVVLVVVLILHFGRFA